jgi:hypothetical protein
MNNLEEEIRDLHEEMWLSKTLDDFSVPSMRYLGLVAELRQTDKPKALIYEREYQCLRRDLCSMKY